MVQMLYTTHIQTHVHGTQSEMVNPCQKSHTELLSASLIAVHLSLWPLAWMHR